MIMSRNFKRPNIAAPLAGVNIIFGNGNEKIPPPIFNLTLKYLNENDDWTVEDEYFRGLKCSITAAADVLT